ncbi:MAG TPA: hypothetical protein VIG75_10825, partial [Citricoccus sp.]
MADLTPEDPQDGTQRPGDTPDQEDRGRDDHGLEEDRRQYPGPDEEPRPRPATPVIVRPASREGYQTVTLNPDRTKDDAALRAKREARRRRRRRRNIALVSAFGVFVL